MTSKQQRTDAWGDPIAEVKRDAWGDPVKETRRDAWGDTAPARAQESRPAHVALFAPVSRLDSERTRDAWGDPVTGADDRADEFQRRVVAAQGLIFEKARPSRSSDEEAAHWVDVVVRSVRGSCRTDSEFLEALERATAWEHARPTPTAPAGRTSDLPAPSRPGLPRTQPADRQPKRIFTHEGVAMTDTGDRVQFLSAKQARIVRGV